MHDGERCVCVVSELFDTDLKQLKKNSINTEETIRPNGGYEFKKDKRAPSMRAATLLDFMLVKCLCSMCDMEICHASKNNDTHPNLFIPWRKNENVNCIAQIQ